jgi:large subunit ribosomal protein L5
MNEFLDRLITIALPRVRDFRGVTGKAATPGATTTWASRTDHHPEIEYDNDRRAAGG